MSLSRWQFKTRAKAVVAATGRDAHGAVGSR